MEAYTGQIKIFAGNFAPRNWAFCDGQILKIQEYPALYSLFNTTYGGDGKNTFALPDLRGRIPVHCQIQEAQWRLGSRTGKERETLSLTQMPSHSHPMQASGQTRDSQKVKDNIMCNTSPINFYKQYLSSEGKVASLSPMAIEKAGNNQTHNNLMPYLCVNFIICLAGTYPQRQN
ncbi:MAG: tail fiber protein [Victivallaceae bacterium]|nr:tail fiber protein [Victivallaceae bacterium]